MLKPAYWIGASLAIAGLCALPALAEGPDGKGPQKGPMVRIRHDRPVFADIDTNKDGTISQAEFEAFKPKGPDGGPPPGGPEDDPGGRPGGRMFHHRMGPPDLKPLDANGDGKVSFEEFAAPMKDHFARLDTNKDGFLDADELKAPPPPREGEGPGGPPPPAGQ